MTNKEYKIKQMRQTYSYCFICQKRCGSWYYYCNVGTLRGRHGNGKPIYPKKYREYKSWKYNRKKQYK